jgi:hypothetical protein
VSGYIVFAVGATAAAAALAVWSYQRLAARKRSGNRRW